MNEKEKKEFYVAMCKCCLLAQAMKSCPLCRFNIGLSEKIASTNLSPAFVLSPVAIPEQMAIH